MSHEIFRRRRAFALGLGAAAASSLITSGWAQENQPVPLTPPSEQPPQEPQPPEAAPQQETRTYSEPEIVTAANDFFGAGAEGVAAVVRHVFAENGDPVGYIEGTEGSGAITVGLRYGNGHLHIKGDPNSYRVYWRGPSVGFDVGGNASKVFTLVYGLTDYHRLYQRFPGVEGSAYFVGGIGVNYQRADEITLAPMRAGVGFRLGANVGYLAYSQNRQYFPF